MKNAIFFVLIIGDAKSQMVERELKIALARGIPILAFAKVHFNNQGKKLSQRRQLRQLNQFLQNYTICKLPHFQCVRI